MTEWYESSPRRLALEAKALARFFPAARFATRPDRILGTSATFVTSVGRSHYVELLFPRSYPNEAPLTYLPEINGMHVPHAGLFDEQTGRFIDNGILCTHEEGEWDPSYTIAVAVAWARNWLEAYDTFRARGGRGPQDWPGPQRVVPGEFR